MGRAKKQIQVKEPVTIRYKEGKNGVRSVYLDCYVNGKRWYEFLSKEIGYIQPEGTADPYARARNAEVLQRANAIKMQRISEIYAGKDSAQKVAKNGKMLLQDWMDIYARKQKASGHKDDRQIAYTKRILLEYAGANVQMQDIDKKFCLGYLQFIKHLRANYAHEDIKSLSENSETNPRLNREHYVIERKQNTGIVKNSFGYWKKLELTAQEIAERIEKKREEDLQTIARHIEAMRNARAAGKNLRLRTTPHTQKELRFFATHEPYIMPSFEETHTIREATASDIAEAEATFIKPATQANYYRCFSGALNAAVRAEIILSNPFDKIASVDKIRVPESAREYLTIDEVKQLIATECKRENVKNAFLFSCFCGLRISDIFAITWGQITQDGEQMRLQLKMQKTKDPLYLPISEQAQKYMPKRGTASAESAIFDLPTGQCCNSIIKDWAKAAGITKKVSFHVARHTFATMMLTLGADLYTTSKLLGHADIETTQIYAKIVNKKKDEAVNLTNGIF